MNHKTNAKEIENLALMSNNHPFRSCQFILSDILENYVETHQFTLDFLSYLNPVATDIMLYYCFEYMFNNEASLMTPYDVPSSVFKLLVKFIICLSVRFPGQTYIAFF